MTKQIKQQFAEHDANREQTAYFFENLSAIFEEHKEFKAGDQVKIQIMRTGNWQHPLYGQVKVTNKTIDDVITNFKTKSR